MFLDQKTLWQPVPPRPSQPQPSPPGAAPAEQDEWWKPLPNPPVPSAVPPVAIPPPPTQTPQSALVSNGVRPSTQWEDTVPDPGQIARGLIAQDVDAGTALRRGYQIYEAIRPRENLGNNVAPINLPHVRDQEIPMRPIDFARTVRVLERQGYHPTAARLLAPTYWQVLKGRRPSPETMIQFMPQLPTEIQSGRFRVVLQPPGMQEAALQAWRAQEAQAQREAEWLRDLLTSQRELALRRIEADEALRRQAIVGAAGPVQAGVQGLQQHPSVATPASPYEALGGAARMGYIMPHQPQRNPQSFMQLIQTLQNVPDDVKAQVLSAFQSWWGQQ